jgi:hypothetical protein
LFDFQVVMACPLRPAHPNPSQAVLVLPIGQAQAWPPLGRNRKAGFGCGYGNKSTEKNSGDGLQWVGMLHDAQPCAAVYAQANKKKSAAYAALHQGKQCTMAAPS